MRLNIIGIAIACLFTAGAAADGVNIAVKGRIVATPCVFNGGSPVVNVNLGNIQAKNMATPASSSAPVPFTLNFTQCPAVTQRVTVTFTGTADPDAGTNYYRNSGTARNIALGIIETRTGNLKGSGSSLTRNINDDRTTTLNMQAIAYSDTGGVTPGTISVAVVATLEYN
ncbi:type 1 fimbrial protein [Leclercia adecarboxylata]|uniref:fimbrial protein n=1 Tax=Leclercia adecarboxylata TaxID=83655 RepID=UPI002DBF35A0|nr:fimbrial protein [Leclercia adecarboxylata]MEB6377368.1 type 1 fimbrial protein [Leclercia adecarboxylata]